MTYSTTARNNMLGANGTTHISLHSAYSATGANELAGGSPAYARKAITFGAAASQARTQTGTCVFDVEAGDTARWVGQWDASTAGNFLGMVALNGVEEEFSVDLTADTVKMVGHGKANGQKVAFYGDTPPTGLTEGTVYFVVGATTDTFQVAATLGGSAINLTGEPGLACVCANIAEETSASQWTLTVSGLVQRLDR